MAKHAELNPHAPQLRKVVANILTDGGWVNGTFQVPERQSLVDFFAGGVQLVKTTRVRFPKEKELFPFIAFRRDAIHLIEAGTDEAIEAAGSGGHTVPHAVSIFLLAGLLYGNLEVLIHVRLSDFLRQQPGMLVLRETRLVPYGEPADSAGARRMRVVLVNMAKILGVGEAVNPVEPLG